MIPNAGDEAYAALLLDDQSWQAAADGLSALPDPLLRAVTWTNAWTRVRSGQSSVDAYLDVVARHLAAETDPVVFEGVLTRLMRLVLPQWTAPESLAAAERCGGRRVRHRPARPVTPDRGLAAMRRLAQTSTDVDLLQGWLATGVARPGLEVDRDTRWLVVRRLLRSARPVPTWSPPRRPPTTPPTATRPR